MANANGLPDKNLSNVVEDLAQNPVNSHQAQQLQQKSQDRKHQAQMNHDKTPDLGHMKS